MACENCDCEDCRLARAPECDYEWNRAAAAGRYRNAFGCFRAWLTPEGKARFQYNADPENEYTSDEWAPIDGDEACFDGTFGMLHNMPEFEANLAVWARRRYWRSPEEFAEIQCEYNRQNQANSEYYSRSLDDMRARYEGQLADLQAAVRQLSDEALAARSEVARLSEVAQQSDMVTLSVLHEQAD